MATARDLQRQINTVKNQARVFSALQTVSSVKFRKAEARVKKARPYADNVEEMMRDVAGSASGDLPLLVGREVNRVAICTLTADRGLAGGFNAQVLRRTVSLRNEKDPDALQVASGRKAVAFFRFRRVELAEVFTGFTDNPTYEKAREIGSTLTNLFEDEEADEVYLVFNRFESVMNQRPVVKRLLPVAEEGDEEEDDGASLHGVRPRRRDGAQEARAPLRGDDGVAGAPRRCRRRARCQDDGHEERHGQRERPGARPYACR